MERAAAAAAATVAAAAVMGWDQPLAHSASNVEAAYTVASLTAGHKSILCPFIEALHRPVSHLITVLSKLPPPGGLLAS